MLQKLGRQLTLLNVLISGAILIVMALSALGVTERMMVLRNENELNAQMNMVLSAVRTEHMDGAEVKLALPIKYKIYFDNQDTQSRLGSAQIADVSWTQLLPPEVQQQIGQENVDGEGNQRMLVSSFVAREGGEGAVGGDAQPDLNVLFTRSVGLYTLSGTDGRPYRVAVSAVSADGNEDTLMLMQDRTDEFGERDRLRWLFAVCVLGALGMIVLSSLLLSAKAVAPIEASIAQQRAFVAAASHELRTPIAALCANAEVLRDAPLGAFEPYLNAIEDEGRKMGALVGDLLHLARADIDELPMRIHPVDMRDAAQEAIRRIAPLAAKADIALEPNLVSATVMGDVDRLCQALIALLDNAVKCSPRGSEVRVTSGQSGHCAFIQVEDDGPGIEDMHKQRVFDRFYRVDTARSREHGGAGLGLPICRQLVERMRGRVSLTDSESGGCRFRIELPMVD